MVYELLKKTIIISLIFFASMTFAEEPFVINKGTYTYYSRDNLLKCFEVLEQPKLGSRQIPIRAVLMKENCSQSGCDPIQRVGIINLDRSGLTFALEHGFVSHLDSVFMRARAIYGSRGGKHEVYFYVPNTNFKCLP